jgi:hypothetical protein
MNETNVDGESCEEAPVSGFQSVDALVSHVGRSMEECTCIACKFDNCLIACFQGGTLS